MIGFKSYLFEGWKRERSTIRQKIHHVHEIDGHKVEVKFTSHKRSSKLGGHWKADFYVNGDPDRKQTMSPDTGRKILHHVHKTFNHFVSKKKPESVTAEGNTNRKHHLYKTLFNHMAKREGAKTFHSDTFGSATIEWNR